MYKYEKMAKLIESYLLKNTNKKESVLLSALEVRKIDGMDSICPNTCYDNVCRAMDAVNIFPSIYITGKRASSTYTLQYNLNIMK